MSDGLKALKRIRQETCPSTYMVDFDKDKCCDIIEKELKENEKNKKNIERVKILLSKEMLYKYLGLNVGRDVLDYANRYIDDILKEE